MGIEKAATVQLRIPREEDEYVPQVEVGTNEIAVILFFSYFPYRQKQKIIRFVHLLALTWPDASLSYSVKVSVQLSVLWFPSGASHLSLIHI